MGIININININIIIIIIMIGDIILSWTWFLMIISIYSILPQWYLSH